MGRWIFLIILFGFCSYQLTGQKLLRYTHEAEKMGTIFRFILYSSSVDQAKLAIEHALASIDSLNLIFSDYEAASEVHLMTSSQVLPDTIKVSEHLWKVLAHAQHLSSLSNGAFDVTIGPLSKLWRRAFRRKTIPDPKEIERARSKVGYKHLIILPDNHVVLEKSGMRMDLGGIAKGYTVDHLLHIIQSYGIDRVLVDGGGDIRALDPPPGLQHWIVQLHTDRSSRTYYLANGAIASSGDRYKYLEWGGKRYSHIIDPRTGYGVADKPTIYVAAKDCVTADALASMASIAADEEIPIILSRYPSADIIRP